MKLGVIQVTSKESRDIRNRPLKRIRVLFVIMFLALTINLLYFAFVQSEAIVINTYNPRLKAIEAGVIRGDVVDRNGVILAQSIQENGLQTRVYPYNNLFAHTIGFVGAGKTGLESYHDLNLIRSNNSFMDVIKSPYQSGMPKGNTLITTLDYDLQAKARELLEGKKGAVVAIEPKTGEILAMVSVPDYNPNTIADTMNDLRAMTDDAPLLNRSTQGLYPPGSTFKVVTTVGYLENNSEANFFHFCEGEAYAGEKVIHCYNNKAHGRIGLEEAFAMSCNTAFGTMGPDIETNRLRAISEQMYYNQTIEFELPVVSSQFTLTDESSINAKVESLIGQGEILVTPLNNALIACAVANEGVVYKPHLTHSIVSQSNEIVDLYRPEIYDHVLSKDMAETIGRYMVATSEYGTAKSLDTENYTIASKTGTAENAQGKAHAWYIGYAPADNPQIALAIIVENSGSSSDHAVPIADALYKNYFSK